MIKQGIMAVLRSPVELGALADGEGFLKAESRETYPIMDGGVICMLKEEEREEDLGDERFYEKHPFGERDWSSLAEVEAGVEKELKALVAQYPKSAMVADIGCGAGRISIYLGLAGYENVVSLDYSMASITHVARNSRNTCVLGNNLHLPFADGSFDLVVSSGVVHHTPDPHGALRECMRVVKPGGRLYLRVYNILSPYAMLYYTYGAVLRLLDSTGPTRPLSDILGLGVYRLARRTLFGLKGTEERILRAKFANLFLKRMVYFFGHAEVAGLLRKGGMEIEKYRTMGFTHRMLFYVARKRP